MVACLFIPRTPEIFLENILKLLKKSNLFPVPAQGTSINYTTRFPAESICGIVTQWRKLKMKEMELYDWKQIENSAEAQMNDAQLQYEVGKVLYNEACKKIWELGGKTNKEIDREEKKKREKDDKS
jgi:hypothetical protein